MFLGFLGITDVEFVYAEGLAMGRKDEALAKAGSEIARIAANAEVARLAA
jgi:FMN-dependent NADH-azoreductase